MRNWLRENGGRGHVPGEVSVEKRYFQFDRELPPMCRKAGVRPSSLTFVDYRSMVIGWKTVNPP